VLPAGATQTTQHVYGVTGVINSNDLLASTIYPDNGQPHTESYTYSYDSNGNRTQVVTAGTPPTTATYQTGTGNRISSDGTFNYIFDHEGNLQQKSKGAGQETWYYTYDNANRLVSVRKTSDGSTNQVWATYTYDVEGHRVKQQEWTLASGLTTVTRFAYDGDQVWADLDNSNNVLVRYLYGTGVDDILTRTQVSGTTATVMAYLRDRLGSVRDLLQFNTQTIVEHRDYDGFGNIVVDTAPAVGDRYGFTGREFDSNTGLQYNRARYYDPATGRWISEDPLRFAAGDANLYRYVRNQSTGLTDPSGLVAPPPGFERIGGNRFGDWTIEQFGIDAPAFGLGTGKDTDNYGSLGKITFTPAPGAVTADTVGFIQIVRMTMVKKDDPSKKKDMTHRGPDKIKHRITAKGWAVDRQPRIFGWYGCDDTGNPQKPIGGLGMTITPWRPGNGKRPAVLEDLPSGPEPNPDVTLPLSGWIIKYEFETYAVEKLANGKPGRIYGGISWGFTVDSQGKVASLPRKFISTPSADFFEAIAAWNKQAAGPPAQRTMPGQRPLDIGK
jgi:RHS repeat-associated protein